MTEKKRGQYIKNSNCLSCENDSSLGVYLNRDTLAAYGVCHKCGVFQEEVDVDSSEIVEKKEKPFEQVNITGTINPLKSRGISFDTARKYGVLSDLDAEKNDITHYYPHTVSDNYNIYQCVRDVKNKRFKWINSNSKLNFFGQNIAGEGGTMIMVTEGACDALAACDMLAQEGKRYRVISLVNGSGGAVNDFTNNYEWISTFENIILAFDQDNAGAKAAKAVAKLFPANKVKILSFSENDPNEMLRKGKAKEFLNSIFQAKEGRPDGIVSVDDIFDEAIKPPVKGLSFPWPTLTEATYGYRRKELWGIGAGSGSGKTEWFKEMINHTINTHHLVAGVLFLEESAAKTLKVIAGKKVNKRFHIPQDRGGDWVIEELVDGINDLKGKIYLYNHNGAKDWESIKSKIRYMANAMGIKDFFLDHLTALVAQEQDEYRALNRIMEELASLTEELDCTIFFISHLRNPSGTPHEEGGRVTVDQFKGSGAIRFWSHFLIGLERNQQAEDEEERNTTTLRVLKDRDTGLSTGLTFKLKYDHSTGRWGELNEDEFDDNF
jgi:twinkle protein